MNQDQVKDSLLKLKSDLPDFQVIFSGKSSRKIDGLYHPERQEIVIHNKNFTDDNSLMYTAIHEFAHHVHYSSGSEIKSPHNNEYWAVFHGLLRDAETAGIYENVVNKDERFILLVREIKKHVGDNGQVMKNLGKLLIQALNLCHQNHVVFEDFIDRAIGMRRSESKNITKVYAMDVDTTIGYDTMKMVASVKDPHKRHEMQVALAAGQSEAEVRDQFKYVDRDTGFDLKKLIAKKKKLEKKIQEISQELAYLEAEIEGVS